MHLRHFSVCSVFLAPKIALDVYGNFIAQAMARDVKSQFSYFYANYLSYLRLLFVFYLSTPYYHEN
jgi:hypothetical protein